jgi:glycosyltransferase involved in cell wall biosynthesis
MRWLAQDGFHIICVCDDDEWTQALRDDGFEVWPIGMGRRPGPLSALSWGFCFFRALRSSPVDVVHTHNAFHGLVGRVVARLARVPVVVQTIHNWWYLDPPGSRRARMFRFLERLAARFSDRVLFLNRDDLQRAEIERIVPAPKRGLIGNGIDLDGFSDRLERVGRHEARATLGLDETHYVVATVARLEWPKDHDTLLAAFAEVKKALSEARLLVVGQGLDSARIQELAQTLGVHDRVDFLGHLEDVVPVLRAADVFVLSSAHEGIPRCLIEGMLAGLPLVASDVVGIRDVIDDRRTGLRFPLGNARTLAAALLELASDACLSAELGREARRTALERFDERKSAAAVGEAYRELLARVPNAPASPVFAARFRE